MEETAIIYETIKKQPLDELMDISKSLFPNYKKNIKCRNNTIPTQIKFCVTSEEYKTITEMASAENLSLSRFCKLKALRNKTVNLDTSSIEQICDELTVIKKILQNILLSIYYGQHYIPKDLEMIQNNIDRISQLHESLLIEFIKLIQEIRHT